MHVTGIFSNENGAPIENWLLNSVEGLMGPTIFNPSIDYVEVTHISNTEVWKELKKKG